MKNRTLLRKAQRDDVVGPAILDPSLYARLRHIEKAQALLGYTPVPKEVLKVIAIQCLAGDVFNLTDIPIEDRHNVAGEVFTPLSTLSPENRLFLKEKKISFFFEFTSKAVPGVTVQGAAGAYPKFTSMQYLNDTDFRQLKQFISVLSTFIQEI